MASTEYYATGRRKTSAARVFLRPGTGVITVNHREFQQFFTTEQLRMNVRRPLVLTETGERFDVLATVAGGGDQRPGRRDPARHRPRARALTTSSCARLSRRTGS